MITETASRLQYLCDNIPALISAIAEADFTHKPTHDKWSKKEILGHLIDSATNNHQRFLRIRFENTPVITYHTNNWNAYSNYNLINSAHLILFWTTYNHHLIEILKKIEPQDLTKQCIADGKNAVSLEYLVKDYVVHMEHHLKQITDYN
jgi:hypothetical protein